MKTREEKLLEKKIRERKRKERIKSDPILYMQHKQKDRERYERRKLEGKITKLCDKPRRTQIAMRQKSRISSKKHYEKKKKDALKVLEEHLVEVPCNLNPEARDPLSNSPVASCSFDRKLRSSFNVSQKSQISILDSRENTPEMENKVESSLSEGFQSPCRFSDSSTKSNTTSREQKGLVTKKNKTPPSKKAKIRNYKYRINKEFKILHNRIAELKALSNSYRMQLSRMKRMQQKITKNKNVQNSENKSNKINSIRKQMDSDIQDFYNDDENSRILPGKRNHLIKAKKQTRVMTESLYSLHKKFQAKNPKVKVSYSYFCKQRPAWVKVPKLSNRETCLCTTHENFKHIVTALKKYDIISQKSEEEILECICCVSKDVKCLSRGCEKCRNKRIEYREFDNNKEITYVKWIKDKIKYTNHKSEEKTTLQTSKKKMTISPKDLITEFEGMLPIYMNHVANCIAQNRYKKIMKANLEEDQCMIHCDFSENYATKYAEEIQSFHFGGSRQQISLHTTVIYYKKNGETVCQSFCTLCKSLRHDAVAVWVHLMPVLDFIEKEIPQIKTLLFLSDSPSAQYRNRKMFFIISCLHWHMPSLNCVEWNYTESGHGKGAPDGVGGSIKGIADNVVSRGHDISDIQSLLYHLRQHTENMIIAEVEESQMLEKDLLVPADLVEFKGTMKVHQVIWNADNKDYLIMRSLSCEQIECLHKSIQCQHGYHLGQYVLPHADREGRKTKSKANSKLQVKNSNPNVIITSCKVIKAPGLKKNYNEYKARPDQKGRTGKENRESPVKPQKENEQKIPDCGLSDIEISKDDSFWQKISTTDVEKLITSSFSKVRFSKLDSNPVDSTSSDDDLSIF